MLCGTRLGWGRQSGQPGRQSGSQPAMQPALAAWRLVPPLEPALAAWRTDVGLGALFGAHNCGSSVASWSHILSEGRGGGTNSPKCSHHCVRQTVLPDPLPCARSPGRAEVEGPNRHTAPTILCAKQCSWNHFCCKAALGWLQATDMSNTVQVP